MIFTSKATPSGTIQLDDVFGDCGDCGDLYDLTESPLANRCGWCQRLRDLELQAACEGVVQVVISDNTTKRIHVRELSDLLQDCAPYGATREIPVPTDAELLAALGAAA